MVVRTTCEKAWNLAIIKSRLSNCSNLMNGAVNKIIVEITVDMGSRMFLSASFRDVICVRGISLGHTEIKEDSSHLYRSCRWREWIHHSCGDEQTNDANEGEMSFFGHRFGSFSNCFLDNSFVFLIVKVSIFRRDCGRCRLWYNTYYCWTTPGLSTRNLLWITYIVWDHERGGLHTFLERIIHFSFGILIGVKSLIGLSESESYRQREQKYETWILAYAATIVSKSNRKIRRKCI